MTEKRIPGTLGIHTQRAIDRLKEGSPGNTLDRNQMEAIIGRKCGHTDLGYGNVCTAIRHVESNFGVVWRWCRAAKVWLCLDDSEVVGVAGVGIQRARRTAGRAVRVGQCVDVTKLDETTRLNHAVNQVAASMMKTCGGGTFRNRLAKCSGLDALQHPDPQKLITLMSGIRK